MPSNLATPGSLIRELRDHIEFLGEVVDERHDLTKLGKVCEEFCTYYRALGICLLSGDGNTDGFFHYLIQSALTRRYYLAGIAPLGSGDPAYRRASFLDPVFDAVAARQWRLAEEILGLISHTWSEGEEYEDDFCYADCVRCLVTGDDGAIQALVLRWTEILEGAADPRLPIVRSLAAREAPGFTEALNRFLRSEDAKARAAADPVTGRLVADEATFFPNKWVSVEGLALLAIAERRKIQVPEELVGCPPLAREAEFSPFKSQGFPHVAFTNE